ncbi:T9SS type A sorting domain-containing protein [Oceanihabitans sp. 2_MG-2023]|uniref:T9SS type A sorting domain-containing protein n=1 Tax=Oceanihabitans sp. 2_MG-2023 TaxID=3062661 RepID=UPI0026E2C7C9|nr:T9SS type A sorting domain-containing protein [Oceanihabitans sp. 2_MG-2023]MDO6598048.1 T9SS type A sorting domain-containing protein [Oceanihabitans sp. 2_MG-2023]
MKQVYIFIFFALSFKLSFSQVINPISATTTATSITGSLNASYDQTGLVDVSDPTTNHSGATTSNSFACNCQNPVFDFDLGGTYTIDGIIFWNAGVNPPAIYTDDGVNTVKFYSSTDGVNYSEIIGGPTSYTQNSYLNTITDEILAITNTFNSVSVTHIRMEVLSNFHGQNFTSFSEIAFTTNNDLSTNDIIIKKSVKIFPNPSVDYIQIQGLTKSENYRIYNVIGSEISKGSINTNKKIDVSNYSNGLYFLKFENGDTIKFLKE